MDLLKTKGTSVDKQVFNWKEFGQHPISKLDDDAFTRVRVILMNGIEAETVRFQHFLARTVDEDLRVSLAKVRRVDHFQNLMINWLLPADQSPLETTLAYEQVAIEVTADVAQKEPDPYFAQVYRFGMLEDFDHLYRFSALYDRTYGKDPNTILQSYTDIRMGRPTFEEHRAPMDELRVPYDCRLASPLTKMHALTIVSAEHQVADFYMNIGPLFPDPVARRLYAEIASIEEQHVTQYESITDYRETGLEKWLLFQANEVYNYYSCVEQEKNPRVKALWERFLDYELGQLHFAIEIFKDREKRDPAEFLPEKLPDPILFNTHRAFVREVLNQDTNLRARGTQFVEKGYESEETLQYRAQLNSQGSPSQEVAAGYHWAPGTELRRHLHLYETDQPIQPVFLKKGA